ncbi:MAG: carboxymuconolactone decarboxylase family protein [Acidimicrobiales bacterium]
MSRLAGLPPEQQNPEQRATYDAIAGGRRASATTGLVGADGALVGPFNAWVHLGAVGGKIQAVGEAMRFELTVDRRLAELAILCVAQQWRAQFEWWAHARMAAQAGLPDAIIEAMRVGSPPPLLEPADVAVHALATALVGPDHRIPQDVYQQAVALLGQTQVIELVNLVGYYCLVSCVLNGFAVALPDGVAAPFGPEAVR